ncbi:MAG: hypothetical protein LUD27_06080 [Clostridia bacterium]|nr:hypothetical protein [Clostridia bacterium]
MILKTIYSEGKDRFGQRFDRNEWSAPIMVSPEEIKRLIDSFSLCGKKIKQVNVIGRSYIHGREDVEDVVYDQLQGLSEAERHRLSDYENINPDMLFCRHVEIDEPFMIMFEDGDIFEIDTPQEPEFRMSMNCIPWGIGPEVNISNIKADIIFSNCKGQIIKSVEVNKYITDKDPMYSDKFEEPPYERELVSDITLRFENDLGLRIGPWIDFCYVECIDKNNDITKIKFVELKQALCNPENE